MTRGWWLPAELRNLVDDVVPRRYRTPEHGDFEVEMPRLTPVAVAEVAARLRMRAERVLRRRPVKEIVELLDRAAAQWLDPDSPRRAAALDAIPRITGYSRPMVAHAIDLEQRSSRAEHLRACLRSEIGDPALLDEFHASPQLAPGGMCRALGPGLVGGVFSANIPALPHLTVMRALLVKAACLGRSSAGEPAFLPLYLEGLAELDEELASALGVLWWERDDARHWTAFLERIEFLVAYGGADAERDLRDRAPAGLPLLYHGHRLGLSIVEAPRDAAARRDLAARLAYDATVFDQHACLSPQLVLALGDFERAAELGGDVAREMERLRGKLPPRILEPAAAARLAQLRGVAEIAEALGEAVRLIVPEDGGGAWTVLVEAAEGLPPSPLDRFLRIVPEASADAALDRLRPYRGLLQNIAVEVASDQVTVLQEALAQLGASRICPPGQMATPSMMWHHDGQGCVGTMVRWCDFEVQKP